MQAILRFRAPLTRIPPAAQQQTREFKRFIDIFTGRQLAGTDDGGNSYYWRVEKDDHGSDVIKRWIEYSGEADGGLVPPVWNSWLRGTRHHPPTPEELQHFAAQRENLRVNVEKLKVEERKRALLVKAEASRKKEQDSTVSEISR